MTEDELIASFRPTFTVGQRVRVRLSGECNVAFWGPHGVIGHPSGVDGATGVIQQEPWPLITSGWGDTHPYGVTFDVPIMVDIRDGGPLVQASGNYFAATELEPLDVFVEDHADPGDLDENGHFKPGVDASAAFNRAMREADR